MNTTEPRSACCRWLPMLGIGLLGATLGIAAAMVVAAVGPRAESPPADNDRETTADLAKAVVDAYLDQVVEHERDRRRERLGALRRLYADKQGELKEKREDLQRLAKPTGTSDPPAIAVKRQAALDEYAECRRELSPLKIQLREAEADLKFQEALLSQDDDTLVSETDLDDLLRSDSIAEQLLYQWGLLQQRLDDVQTTANPRAKAQYEEKLGREMRVLEAQIDARQAVLREELKVRQEAAIGEQIKRLKIKIAVLAEQQKELEEDLSRQREELEQVHTSTGIDQLPMGRAAIERLAGMLDRIAEEIDVLEAELGTVPRTMPASPEPVPNTEH